MKTPFFICGSLFAIAVTFAAEVAKAPESYCLENSADAALVSSGNYVQVKTFMADSSLARCYIVKKGTELREGTAYTFHPDGEIAVKAPYRNGQLDGSFQSFYENGKPWQVIGYKDGVEEGSSCTYYESGIKKLCEVYKDGTLDGLTEEWTERGTIRRKLPYEKGQVHGKAVVYDELGAVKEEMTFERGIRHGFYRRYEKGVKVLEAEFQSNRCVKNCDF